jgi:hypothetical protein
MKETDVCFMRNQQQLEDGRKLHHERRVLGHHGLHGMQHVALRLRKRKGKKKRRKKLKRKLANTRFPFFPLPLLEFFSLFFSFFLACLFVVVREALEDGLEELGAGNDVAGPQTVNQDHHASLLDIETVGLGQHLHTTTTTKKKKKGVREKYFNEARNK